MGWRLIVRFVALLALVALMVGVGLAPRNSEADYNPPLPFTQSTYTAQIDPEGAHTPGDEGEVYAGQELEFKVTYNHTGTDAAQVFTWVNIDANDADLQDRGGGVRVSAVNNSTDSPYSNYTYDDRCYRGGAADGAANFVDKPPLMPPMTPYDPDTGLWSSCGSQGYSALWKQDDTHTNSHWRFKITIDPDATSKNHVVCMRAHVAVGTGPSTTVSVNALGSVRAATTDYCVNLQSTTISGNVHTSNGVSPAFASGTGTNIPLKIQQGKQSCSGEPGYNYRPVDDSGNFSFDRSKGSPFCLDPPDQFTISNTTYYLQTPVSNGNNGYLYQVGGLRCSDVTWLPTCGSNQQANDLLSDTNYDFTYDAVPRLPTAFTKSVSPSGNVTPGQTITYTVTLENSQYANLPNMEFEDFVPLNMNLTSVTANYNGVFQLCTYPVPVINLASSTFGHSSCSVSSGDPIGSPFAGTTPPKVKLSFDRFPRASTSPSPNTPAVMTVVMTGTVKAASDIGVYPYNTQFCTDYGARTDWSQAGITAGCQNQAAGLQSVINFARMRVNGSYIGADDALHSGVSPWNNTNEVLSPIPGDVGVTKTSSARDDGNGSQVISTTPGYDTGTYTVSVDPVAGQGPVQYTVTDQPGGINSNIDYVTGSGAGSGTFSFAGAPGSGVLTWADISSGGGAKQFTWIYQAKPSVAALAAAGGSVSNTGQACFYPKWNPGWQGGAQICRQGSTVLKAVKVDDPFLTTDNGSVHGGGGIGDSCVLNGDTETGKPRLNGNSASSTGKYFVSVAGDASNVSNIGFTSIAGTKNTSYNRVCRPDVVKSVQDFIAANSLGAFIGLPLGTPINGTYASGAVVSPNFGLPIAGCTDLTTQNISGRWTLFVNGDLCIHGPGNGGALKYNTAAALLSGTSSFGVVVTGNIYIDQDVTELDGFYFAGKNNGGNTSGGVINTCARDGAFTLQSNNTTAGYHIKNNECVQPLVVNGIMMGRSFRFNRVTPPNNGTVYSEIIDFRGQLYTVTPPGLSNLNATDIQPKYLGERRSRY